MTREELIADMEKRYQEARVKMARGELVGGMYHCECHRAHVLEGNYRASCWICDSNC